MGGGKGREKRCFGAGPRVGRQKIAKVSDTRPWPRKKNRRTIGAPKGGTMRTQVGIVGAGPAGLMLSHLLHPAGVSSIFIEDRSPAFCEARGGAGLLENSVTHLMMNTRVGDRPKREPITHHLIFIS